MQEKQKRYKETNQTTRKRSNLVLLGRTDLVIRTTWYLLLKKILSAPNDWQSDTALPPHRFLHFHMLLCSRNYNNEGSYLQSITIVYKILSNFYLFCHSIEIKGEKYKYLHFVDVILPSKHHLSKI